MKKILKTIVVSVLVVSIALSLVAVGINGDETTVIPVENTVEENRDNLVTRGKFAEILSLNFEENQNDLYTIFSDVDKNHPCQVFIQEAVNSGWMSGYGDGTFKPDKFITYEEAIAGILRAVGLSGSYFSYPEDYISSAIEYSITTNVHALSGEELSYADAYTIIINAKEYLETTILEDSDNVLYLTKSLALGRAYSSGGSAYAMAEEAEYEDADGYSVVFSDSALSVMYPWQNSEEYTKEAENVFKSTLTSPLSTFSIDTDTASYSNLRRFVLNGQNIPNGSVRTEELINYFDYKKAETEEGKPFGVNFTVSDCPWNKENKLVMLTVSGEEMTEYKPSNLVFLIDTSGSMYDYNKLPLVKQALKMLLEKLGDEDKISIVTYASGTSVALEPTKATEKEKIIDVIDSLYASGATSGASGINLAYEQAEKFKTEDGNNRIILCTDGDFNVGISSTGDLEKLIEEKRETGIYLSVLGFGMGNYKDNKMETLADKGNGNYAYIDNLKEAKKVLVDDMSKTIYTIAKDVKIQVEFNPGKISEYRLIGYENRILNNEDFDNDKKDAGELGAGATVTVLYEIVPIMGDEVENNLKYQSAEIINSEDLMTVKIRYKEPESDSSILCEYVILDKENAELCEDFNFAAAVCELGMILNESEFAENITLDDVIRLARNGIGEDNFGLRSEFVQLVDLLKYNKD